MTYVPQLCSHDLKGEKPDAYGTIFCDSCNDNVCVICKVRPLISSMYEYHADNCPIFIKGNKSKHRKILFFVSMISIFISSVSMISIIDDEIYQIILGIIGMTGFIFALMTTNIIFQPNRLYYWLECEKYLDDSRKHFTSKYVEQQNYTGVKQ